MTRPAPLYVSLSVLAALVLAAGGVGALAFGPQAEGPEPPDLVVPADARDTPSARSWLPEVPASERREVTNTRVFNAEATVPPQCYTQTRGQHNPCYTCHQSYDRSEPDRLNQLDDGSLQGDYGFSDVGVDNHWSNLFVDRRAWVASITDEAILAYVSEDNYTGLAERLREQGFAGFVPDLAAYPSGAAAFDERGLARDGSHWVAFNYKPFLGTFWPTNGSADDVLIRLPEAFRSKAGAFHRDVYFVNLTLVELNVKQEERAPIWPVDELQLGFDVDGDGALGTATEVVRGARYAGDAADVALAFQQFPAGTEIMHSVRYLGVDDQGRVVPSTRMKELRYMRKVSVLDRGEVANRFAAERREKRLGELPSFITRGDEGLDNGLGWFVQGFIEDYEGELRPQSREEATYCMGCHTSIGTTIDSVFSMARKVPGAAGWGYVNLVGMPDAPSIAERGGEIANYLARAGGGSEFRENDEMLRRFFTPAGAVDAAAVAAAPDVYTLTTPSPRRALDLNKAYVHIVRHQNFIEGRDATIAPVTNVHRRVDEATEPLEPARRFFGWDLRLRWPATEPTAP
jgi:hypothetical protein